MKKPAFVALLAVLGACASTATDTADPPATAPEAEPAAATARASTYAMTASDFKAMPEGCRTGADERDAWSLEMAAPNGERWSATERYGSHATPYTCEKDGEGFSCRAEAGFDYGKTGMAADVKLDIRYDGRWKGDDGIAGSFELGFTCEGDACDKVASQWGVASFPCLNNGNFEGSRG